MLPANPVGNFLASGFLMRPRDEENSVNEQLTEVGRTGLGLLHPIEYRIFSALDDDFDGSVEKREFIEALDHNGLSRKDPRLAELYAKLDSLTSETLDFPVFLAVIQSAAALIERMLIGDLAVPDFHDFSTKVKELFDATALNEDGQQATYIPPLAEVNPDQFAVAVMSIDGQLLELGQTETDFSVQSACKPFNYCYASQELGADKVHEHVGMEPSGQAFNARVLMSDGTNRPHNPMINAGAIMTASLIKAGDPLHRRLEYVRNMWSKMVGGEIPRFNAWMAQEESRTGDNNRALGYMMKSAGVLLNGEDSVDHELRDALELYFSACSLELTAREMATAAATLANNGVCPITQERVLDESTVRNCLTMMQMCGMYDGSGEFSLKIGLPAKSGVGGAVILVVPRLMGICIWSPRLDAIGNSVRGVEMAERMAETFRVHLYDGLSARHERIDPRVRAAQSRARETSQALRAASLGDIRTLQRLFDDGCTLKDGDYDRRTPMHLAAAEGQLAVVRFLLERGVNPNTSDRWGGTPLGDAEFGNHADVADLLKSHDAEIGDAQHLVSDSKVTEEADSYGDTEAVVELLWAASENDLVGLRRCLAQGIPVSACDYDSRTALHLAAADGQVEAVSYLLAHQHPLHVRDRWGSTPLDEARREGQDGVEQALLTAEKDFHTLKVSPTYSDVPRAAGFIKRFASAHGMEPLVAYRVSTVLDDVLTNFADASDSVAGMTSLVVELELSAEQIDVTVSCDGSEFNPLAPLYETHDDPEDAQMREISLKLIQGLSDEATYERSEDRNVLRLSFGLDSMPYQEIGKLSA
jgi:glutaminase